MEKKIKTALRILRSEDHTVFPTVVNGRFCFEIDGKVYASCDEMAELADGIYTVAELLQLRLGAQEHPRAVAARGSAGLPTESVVGARLRGRSKRIVRYCLRRLSS